MSNKIKVLQSNPQKKAICTKVYTMNPRKPNSALRKVADVMINNKIKTAIYLPGEEVLLNKYDEVLIQGRGAKDLPGVKCRAVGGKFDFKSNKNRKQRRSIYGIKK
jgi:small subunit ribosomal protein S12